MKIQVAAYISIGENMIGLACGLIGFLLHTTLSIGQARIKTKTNYSIKQYWKEYDYAIVFSLLSLLGIYLIGIHLIESMFIDYAPVIVVEAIHSAENHRISWLLLGLGIPKIMKAIQTWAEH